jgi:hypothetical protein
MAIKPILFNTEMVRAILDGRKSCTRRIIKPQPQGYFEVSEEPLYIYDTDGKQGKITPPYQPGDILYVRETWSEVETVNGVPFHIYKADDNGRYADDNHKFERWYPSIHMPKEAARIWLKVTDVRVERLQDITPKDAENEGVGNLFYEDIGYSEKNYGTEVDPEYGIAKEQFAWLWESTIKKSDLGRYGWNANPWVWVIEFERCKKPEEDKRCD